MLHKPKIVIIIQARMASSRLPNKVLYPVKNRSILEMLLERVRYSKFGTNILIATTTNKEDDLIQNLCQKIKQSYFRGHPQNLLDRHYKAALECKADVVVKIPSDCPLIDPNIIDKVIDFYISNSSDYDYVSNLHPATYPDGNDVEVFPFSVLEIVWHEATKNYEKEHTTPFIWDNPQRFRIGNVIMDGGVDYSMKYRWTLDYFDDYKLIKAVYDELYDSDPFFGVYDIIELMESRPDIYLLNSKFAGVNWYRNHLNELKSIKPEQTKYINTHH